MNNRLSIQTIILFLSLYTSQFLGLSFFSEAFVSILRKNGLPLENIGLIHMIGILWILRFLWAPIIDKIKFKKFSHFKSWIYISQTFMIISLYSCSYFSIKNDITFIITLAIFFSFFSATQNIAVDALIYKTSQERERTKANAIKISGGLIGTLLGGGICLISYSYFGWKDTLIFMSIFTFFSMSQLIFFKEIEITKNSEIKNTKLRTYIEYIKNSKNQRQWYFIIFLYPATVSAAYGLISPILVDKGWSLDKIGFIVHFIGYGLGVMSAFSVVKLINSYGKKKILILSSIGQSIGVLLLLLPINNILNTYIIMSIVGFIFIFYTLSSTILSTMMMDKITNKNQIAFQYTIQHSLFMFGGIFFTTLAISLSGKFGYSTIIISYFFISLFIIYLSFRLDEFLNLKKINNIHEMKTILLNKEYQKR